jgi:hypothetical protein
MRWGICVTWRKLYCLKPNLQEAQFARPPERRLKPAPSPAAGCVYACRKPPGRERFPARELKEMSGPPKSCWQRMELTNVGSPKGRESYGDRVPVVVAGVTTCQGGREGRPQGEGAQATG